MVNDTLRNAGLFTVFHQFDGSERGFFRRLDDKCASCRKGRAHFSRDHRGREIPRRNRCDDTDRLFKYANALIR
ncbi:hypothetical protein KBTX_04403 [wastewater metagenome]|uniref:Uncharacterized protein n=2 Tax=unclassified sequences TaxID=12908 RepID=A0A5B8RL52_9ZZZZ|nr:hypothetical protein KBTEX_04403 [uncultured organism]